VSISTYTSTTTFTPWVSGESLSPANLNRHMSLVTIAIGVENSVVTVNSTITISGSFSASIPVSPVMGNVISDGSTASPAVVQLYNPTTSTKSLLVYELYAHSPSGSKIFVRRSSSTLTSGSGASIFTPALIHMDQSNTTTIRGSFLAYNYTTSSLFTEPGSHWYGELPIEGNDGWQPTAIRQAGAFPWSLATGQALEIISANTGSTETIVVTAIWDEL